MSEDVVGPLDDATLEGRTAIYRQMAESIRVAHDINPNSWVVMRVRDHIALLIGGYYVLSPRDNPEKPFPILLCTPYPDVDGIRLETATLKTLPGTSRVLVQYAKAASVLEQIRDSHIEAVIQAARTVKWRGQYWKDHDVAVIQEVEALSGEVLPVPHYINAEAAASGGNGAPEHMSEDSHMPIDPLSFMKQSVKAQGLTYTDRQLATFYAALQTKGFVVLSGISGTGKSKLAQAFVQCLPDLLKSPAWGILNSESIRITLKPYTLKYHRIYLPSKRLQGLGIPGLNETRKIRISFGPVQAVGSFRHFRQQLQGSSQIRLGLTNAFAEQISSIGVGGHIYLEPELDDDDDVVGFRIGNSENQAEIPDDEANKPVTVSNNLFLSVRPDWRDSRALLGYHNPLLGSYEWTEFLRFVLRAAENFRGPGEDRVAWFVILDEMNLAHVEYYFADLLSVLESGRDAEGWTREAIRIERLDPTEEQDDTEVPPAAIHLPPNLYIVGTVNMDETTHAFSPKVLDRAFTIELSDVDFSAYPPTRADDAPAPIDGDERRALLDVFSRGGRFVGIDKGEVVGIVGAHPEIRTWLQTLNTRLARSQMQFGYRVFDEIAAFVGSYEAVVPQASLEEAFDLAVLMKVLPKFSGSVSRLERPLLQVLAWCVNPDEPPYAAVRAAWDALGDGTMQDHDLLGPGRAFFPVTARRVARMLDTLAVDGFASFG
ncbi:MAG: hypothetical protein QM753_15460 [Thermomicrobiales bacterium]